LTLYKRIKYLKQKPTNNIQNDNEDDLDNFINSSLQLLPRAVEDLQPHLNIRESVMLEEIRAMSRREKVRADSPDFSIFEYLEKQFQDRTISEDLLDMALAALSAPSSQVSVERVFSALAILMQPRRYNLKGARIDDVMVCGLNRNLLDLVDFQKF
jgi:hAT family C-terminal dimerisation region